MTTTDLNVGDVEGLPDALRAAPTSASVGGASAEAVPVVAPQVVALPVVALTETQVVARSSTVPAAATAGLPEAPETFGLATWQNPEAVPQPTPIVPELAQAGAQSFLQMGDQHGITSSAPAPINRLFEASALRPINQEPWRYLADAALARGEDPLVGGLRPVPVPVPVEPLVRFFEAPESAPPLRFGLGNPGWSAQDGLASGDVAGGGKFGLRSSLRLAAVLLAGAGWSAAAQTVAEEGRKKEGEPGRPTLPH
jgi:hypothetical protein